MQKASSNKKIESIKYFACGYCVNKLKFIIKNPPQKTKNFYAGAFLLKHSKLGYILFDTGYSEDIYNCGFRGKLYNLINPTTVKKEDTIIYQLEKEGIKAKEIEYVILSHLHPDHIGGTKYFKNAKFILSEECFNNYKNSRFMDLIFKKMLPDDFENRVMIISKFDKQFGKIAGNDLFLDGSIILTQINGHSRGQLCAYIPDEELMLGADACWGQSFLDKASEMHPLARFIQSNFEEYKNGINKFRKLRDSGIKIYFSHDDYDKKELI